jgi:hypothetical protein
VNFAYLGCFTDYNGNIRDLNSAPYFSNSLTLGSCAIYCVNAGYSYFGVQYAYFIYIFFQKFFFNFISSIIFKELDVDVTIATVHKVLLPIVIMHVVEILMRYVVVLVLILFMLLLHVFFYIINFFIIY